MNYTDITTNPVILDLKEKKKQEVPSTLWGAVKVTLTKLSWCILMVCR